MADTGIGLTREQHHKLFQAFAQADSSRTRKAEGTGLGLSICKNLVEQMGGEIGLESDLGQGATFWFTFKTTQNNQNGEPAVADGCEQEDLVPTPLHGQKVLLIEPHELTRLSIFHLLDKLGATITAAASIRQGMSANKTHVSYDYVFINPDNIEPVQGITQLTASYSNANIIVLSSAGITGAMDPALPDGTDTLLKPVGLNRLKALLTRINGNHEDKKIQQQINKSLSILVVDDNPVNLKLLKTILGNLEQDLQTAENGFDAIELCRQFTFDIIFMDVHMPVIDGLEATKRIRSEIPNHQRTPIIAVTAHALPEEKKVLLQSGFDDYLSKPVSENTSSA